MQQQQLISGSVLYKKRGGETRWVVARRDKGDGWELPKFEVKKTESSVRASLRGMSENGVSSRVLEEAGRATASTSVNGEPLTRRLVFYLMQKTQDEVWGPSLGPAKMELKWLSYASARRSLSLGREQRILSQANNLQRRLTREKREGI